MAVVSFSMQVVWKYLSQRRGGGGGGGGGTEIPTQHFICRSLRKLSFHPEFIR